MINRTMVEDDVLGLDSSMRMPVIGSIVLHVVIFVLTAVGLPFIARDHEIISPPISVEIVTIDKLTQTNRVAAPVKPKEEPKELPPPVQEKPAPPKMSEPSPPEITKPTPPEPKKEAPPVEELAPPKPEKKPEPKKEKPKEKPKPKEEVMKKEKPKAQDFDSLLKNLTPDVKEEQPVEAAQAAKDSTPAESAIAQLSDRLTMSEMDALRHQLGQCWNLGASAGGRYAEEQSVLVRVQINRDRRVQQANVVDMARYNRDGAFRAAADAALRALRNPRCETLQLPPDKFNEWKNTVINFDPSDML